MNQPSTNNFNVEGVILTEKAIARLKQLQRHDNAGIDEFTHVIQRGICALAHNLDNYTEEEITAINHLARDLAFACDVIKDLEKP